MRVFHGIIEIAGQMGILCGGLKKAGHYALGYNTFHSYLGYKDHLVNTDVFKIRKIFRNLLNNFDIFHFHYGTTIWPDLRDVRELKASGKKIIMHHWGNDVRFHGMAKTRNPYVYTGDSPPDRQIRENLKTLSRYFNEAIVQDYEVAAYVSPYYQKVHVLPLAINLKRFRPAYPDPAKKRPLILHAPTNPQFKGTKYIEAAIRQLKAKYKFDYRRVEKMNHKMAVRLYQEADIIIDQVLCGSYGLLSVESMALGKPVVTYIRPDLKNKFPKDLPIISASPENIAGQLSFLLKNPELRRNLGIRGRKYVNQVHSVEVVVKKLVDIYTKL